MLLAAGDPFGNVPQAASLTAGRDASGYGHPRHPCLPSLAVLVDLWDNS